MDKENWPLKCMLYYILNSFQSLLNFSLQYTHTSPNITVDFVWNRFVRPVHWKHILRPHPITMIITTSCQPFQVLGLRLSYCLLLLSFAIAFDTLTFSVFTVHYITLYIAQKVSWSKQPAREKLMEKQGECARAATHISWE